MYKRKMVKQLVKDKRLLLILLFALYCCWWFYNGIQLFTYTTERNTGQLLPSRFKQDVNFQLHKNKNAENSKDLEQSYAYKAYKSMIEEDKKANDRDYPKHSLCAYKRLRKPYTTIDKLLEQPKNPNIACIPRVESKQDCQEVIRYYGKPGTLQGKECRKSEVVSICSIYEETTLNNRQFAVSCNFSKCNGKSVTVGFYNEHTGSIQTDDWNVVHDVKALSNALRDHAARSIFGRGFALLRCFGANSSQVVTLPKVLQRKGNMGERKTKRVNINVIVEDSLSRSHFFRTLPKTTSAFRNIVYDEAIPATVLDFEMFQSNGHATKYNLQRLFSARKYADNVTDRYTIVEFFTKAKNGGYTTLFQDTSCWYHKWAINPAVNVIVGRKNSEKWQNFKKSLRRYNTSDAIDDFGMKFLQCFAYEQLHVTNFFKANSLPKICFSGRNYPSLLLEYNDKYVAANDMSDRPFFSYTHLHTSHDATGRRIVNDDPHLSRLFRKAAHLSNTITIFASDHGGKANRFSLYTSQGRQEVYKPLLFMIIPHQVAKQLGPDIMDSLVANQKRLVTMEDLHHAFLSLFNLRQVPSNEAQTRGLFEPVSPNRQCHELKLQQDVLCLCEGMDNIVDNSSANVKWAAGYAVGTINNRIQNQYIASLNSKQVGEKASHGACQRYIGVRIMRPRQKIIKKMERLQFSLFVKPVHLNTIEVFDVQVTFPLLKKDGIVLSDAVRVSNYEKYKGCANSVESNLCACSDSNYDPTVRWQNEMIVMNKTSRFSLRKLVLDKPCLIIASRTIHKYSFGRSTQDAVVTYEALNTCGNGTYQLRVDTKKRSKTRLSFTKPFTVIIYPRTITFLTAVNNEWKFGKVKLAFKFNKIP